MSEESGTDDAAIVVRDLQVAYGDVQAVKGVSFAAKAGEVTVVLGPNGAGKTSTIEVCEGFRRHQSGEVRVLGHDPSQQQASLSRRMGVMLQEGGVYPAARVGETIRQYCALYDRGVDADQLIDLVGLGDRADRIWKRLSGGEKQRLGLALALAARPEVAFLDEPTSGVDLEGRESIRSIVADLAADGCAVLLATHELDEAERMADRVLIFDDGLVVADGTLDELRAGHDEIRFRCSSNGTPARLDIAALSAAIGLPAEAVADGEYRIPASPTPRLMADITSWLADNGHGLDEIRGGGERLEDLFRRLVAEAPAPEGESR